jgi:uncharacterized membrane protein
MSEEHNKDAHHADEVIVEDKAKSSGTSGSADNDKVLAAVSGIPIVGLITYFAMKDASAFVKNYARQGGVLFIFSVANMVLGFVPVIGWLLSCLVSIVVLVGMILLIVKALQEDKTFKLPVVGDFAESIFK